MCIHGRTSSILLSSVWNPCMHVSFEHAHSCESMNLLFIICMFWENQEHRLKTLHAWAFEFKFATSMSFWIKDVSRVLYWGFLKLFLCIWSNHARPQGLEVVWKPFLLSFLPRNLQLARAKKWWLEPTFWALRILHSAKGWLERRSLGSSELCFCLLLALAKKSWLQPPTYFQHVFKRCFKYISSLPSLYGHS